MGNSIQQIIKGPDKLSVAHWLEVLACANEIYRFVLFTKYCFQYFEYTCSLLRLMDYQKY
jgi:hypothetical protein